MAESSLTFATLGSEAMSESGGVWWGGWVLYGLSDVTCSLCLLQT